MTAAPAPRVGFVCATPAEAAPLAPWCETGAVAARVVGSESGGAAEAARALALDGCRVIVSWGVATALHPSLAPGDILVPDEVRDREGRGWRLDRTLLPPAADRAARLRAAAAGSGVTVLGLDRPVPVAAEKAELHRRTGAALADLETHAVARAAAGGGCRVVALRAISHPATRDLPPLAVAALGGGAHPRGLASLLRLLRRPGQIGRVLAAWRDGERALAALAAVAPIIVPALLAVVGDRSRPGAG